MASVSSPSSSPRLPSPPPIAEDQVGSLSPGFSLYQDHGKLSGSGSTTDTGAARRIRPGTKAEDIHEGPPLIDLQDVRGLASLLLSRSREREEAVRERETERDRAMERERLREREGRREKGRETGRGTERDRKREPQLTKFFPLDRLGIPAHRTPQSSLLPPHAPSRLRHDSLGHRRSGTRSG